MTGVGDVVLKITVEISEEESACGVVSSCLRALLLRERGNKKNLVYSFVTSAPISVALLNIGREFFYPMGSTSGRVTNSSIPLIVENTTANFSMSSIAISVL